MSLGGDPHLVHEDSLLVFFPRLSTLSLKSYPCMGSDIAVMLMTLYLSSLLLPYTFIFLLRLHHVVYTYLFLDSSSPAKIKSQHDWPTVFAWRYIPMLRSCDLPRQHSNHTFWHWKVWHCLPWVVLDNQK